MSRLVLRAREPAVEIMQYRELVRVLVTCGGAAAPAAFLVREVSVQEHDRVGWVVVGLGGVGVEGPHPALALLLRGRVPPGGSAHVVPE